MMKTKRERSTKIINGFRLTESEFRQLLNFKHDLSLKEGKVISIRDAIRLLLRDWAENNPEAVSDMRHSSPEPKE